MNNIIYRIYYGENIIYLGRTHQELVDRIRMHLFKGVQGVKKININNVTKIEYAELPSEADMFLYEIYYINKFKPILNKDDKAIDEMSPTLVLPELKFTEWSTPLWQKWKDEINKTNAAKAAEEKELSEIRVLKEQNLILRNRGERSEEKYKEEKRRLDIRKAEIDYSKGRISFSEYCRITGKTNTF